MSSLYRATIRRALDEYARSWTTANRSACRAGRGARSWTTCLQLRRAQFGELVNLHHSATRVEVAGALDDVLSLPPVESCAELPEEAARSTDQTAQLSVLQRAFGAAEALHLVRDGADVHREVVQQLRGVIAGAEALGCRPMVAEALTLQGQAEQATGDDAAAERTLTAAVEKARGQRLPAQTAAALTALVNLMGAAPARIAETRTLGALAEGIIANRPDLVEMEVHLCAARIAAERVANNNAQAAVQARRCLQRAERLTSTLGSRFAAKALNEIGMSETAAARYAEAVSAFRKSLALVEPLVGPDHRVAATAWSNLGVSHLGARQHGEAATAFEKALALLDATGGLENAILAATLNNAAQALIAQRRYDEALDHLQRAAALQEHLTAPGMQALKPAILNSTGEARLRRGDAPNALPLFRRALVSRQALLGPDHVSLGSDLIGIGECHLAMGRPALALEALERAVRLLEQSATSPDRLASGRFALARALWDAKANRGRALVLARIALDMAKDPAGGASSGMHDQIVAWLHTHERAPSNRARLPR